MRRLALGDGARLLPRRIHVLLQPSQLASAGTAFPSAYGTGSHHQANAVSRSRWRQPQRVVSPCVNRIPPLNYNQSKIGHPTPVGVYPLGATPGDIRDMAGNVWEWCQDVWYDDYDGAPNDGSAWVAGAEGGGRVLRGGSWGSNAWYCRGSFRNGSAPDFRYGNFSFRLAAGT